MASMIQWDRAFDSAEGRIGQLPCEPVILLQWDRAFDSAEGPRLVLVERLVLRFNGTAHLIARKAWVPVAQGATFTSFNGTAHLIARKEERSAGIELRRRFASMGPRI